MKNKRRKTVTKPVIVEFNNATGSQIFNQVLRHYPKEIKFTGKLIGRAFTSPVFLVK